MESLITNVSRVSEVNHLYATCTAENAYGDVVYGVEFHENLPIQQRHRMMSWAEKNSLASGNLCMYNHIWFIREEDFTLFTLTWS